MREKQTTCQNQLAEGDVGNTHTHTHIHTLTQTHAHTHTHTHLLDTSKGVAGDVPKEAAILNKSVSIAVQLQQQLNLSSSRHRKKNEPQVSRCYCDTKSTTSLRQVRKHATRLFGLSSQQARTCRSRSVTRDMSSAWENCCAVTFPRLRRPTSLRLSDKSSFCSQAQGGCH